MVAQILIPYGASLAGPQERGHVVGMLTSGLLLGILLPGLPPAILPALADGPPFIGWPPLSCSSSRSSSGVGYPTSTIRRTDLLRAYCDPSPLWCRDEPTLRARMVYGALAFAVFSVFWTSMAFLLSGEPYSYTPAVIGLFGLVGVAGALIAPFAGKSQTAEMPTAPPG